jgi:hypothetical protein
MSKVFSQGGMNRSHSSSDVFSDLVNNISRMVGQIYLFQVNCSSQTIGSNRARNRGADKVVIASNATHKTSDGDDDSDSNGLNAQAFFKQYMAVLVSRCLRKPSMDKLFDVQIQDSNCNTSHNLIEI